MFIIATFTREHVFYIEFLPGWQTSHLQDLFKNYGPIFISWKSNTSAFVALHNRENFSCVLKTIFRADGFSIKTFQDYQKQVETSAPIKRSLSLSVSENPEQKRIKRKDSENGDLGFVFIIFKTIAY